MLIEGIFLFVSLVYFSLLLSFMVAWGKLNSNEKKASDLNVSVIIPMRNEARNIQSLLRDICCQNTTNRFEVIVVDDDSSDGSPDIVKRYIEERSNGVQVKLIKSNGTPALTPKKRALHTGIGEAQGEIIVSTDGDCRVDPGWLQAMTYSFENHGINFVSGPVAFSKGNGTFERLQMLEFASLIGAGASSMAMGFPNICNGANLAFRKSIFSKLNGYNGNGHLASGDDEFLLSKFVQYDKKGVRFIKDSQSVVSTSPKPTFSAFYEQRKRWASKLRHHKEWSIKLISGGYYLVNVMFLIGLMMTLVGTLNWQFFIPLITIKAVLEGLFIWLVVKFLREGMSIGDFLLLEIIHPLYITILGIVANYGSFKWKGRTYYE